MSSKSQIDGLELAELVFFAIATLPATYCLIKHGRHGILGWLNVLILCGLRIASSAMATTGNPSKAASIISGIGLSPLLLAALGLLHEAYVTTGTVPRLENTNRAIATLLSETTSPHSSGATVTF